MNAVIARGLANRTGEAIMAVGRHRLRGLTNGIDGLRRSKRLAASMSHFSAPHRVNQVAMPIEDPREGAPFSMHFNVGVIHIAGPRLFALVVSPVVGLR